MKLLDLLSLLTVLIVLVPGSLDALVCRSDRSTTKNFEWNACYEESDAACFTKYEYHIDEKTKANITTITNGCTTVTDSNSTQCPVDRNGKVVKNGCGYRSFSKQQSCCCTEEECNSEGGEFRKTDDVDRKTITCNKMRDPKKTNEENHESHNKEQCWFKNSSCFTHFKAVGDKSNLYNYLYYTGCASKSSCPLIHGDGCSIDKQNGDIRCCCSSDNCNNKVAVEGNILVNCKAIVNSTVAPSISCPWIESACHSRFSISAGGLYYLGCAPRSHCPKEKDADGCWTDKKNGEVHCCCDTEDCNDGNQAAGKQLVTATTTITPDAITPTTIHAIASTTISNSATITSLPIDSTSPEPTASASKDMPSTLVLLLFASSIVLVTTVFCSSAAAF